MSESTSLEKNQMILESGRRMARKHSVSAMLVFGLVLIPVLYWIGAISIETVNMLGRYMCFAIVAVGLDLIWGYTGILSLCQAFFFSLGGYSMGMYLAHHGGAGGATDSTGWEIPACLHVVSSEVGVETLPWFWKPFYDLHWAVILGLLIPGIVAALIGFVGFRSRVRGVYFAILTQAITVAAWLVFCMNNMKFCGTNGLTNFDKILGHPLSENYVKLALYLATVVSLATTYFLCRYIVRSRLGRVLIAVRDDENTLRFSGYKPYMYKMFAFTVAAMFAGLGGMLYAPQMGIFTPANMEASASILVVIWVAVGGRGSLSGAVLGALVVNLLYNYLTSVHNFYLLQWKPDYWPIVLGLLFIVVVLKDKRGKAWLLFTSIVKKFIKNPYVYVYKGRMNRSEFLERILIIISLGWIIGFFVMGTIASVFSMGAYIKILGAVEAFEHGITSQGVLSDIGIFISCIPLGILLNYIAYGLMSKRWHDLGRSGLWSLLFLVPIANILALLMLIFVRGQPETNQYGENPLY